MNIHTTDLYIKLSDVCVFVCIYIHTHTYIYLLCMYLCEILGKLFFKALGTIIVSLGQGSERRVSFKLL